jgi:hypothetical protein
VLQDLAQHPAVAAAGDEHAARCLQREERGVRHRLVVDELVAGRRLHNAVDEQHAAEVAVLEDDDVPRRAPALVQDRVRLQAGAPVRVQRLLDPPRHVGFRGAGFGVRVSGARVG